MKGALIGVVSLLSSSVALAELREPETGATFDETITVEGRQYQCLGTGVRKMLWIRAYAITYCLGEQSVDPIVDDWVKTEHGKVAGPQLARELQKDGTFYARLVRQPGDRLVVMKMTRDVSRDRLASAFEDSLSDVLPAESVQKLIDAIPSDAKSGQVVRIWSEGSQVTIDIAGQQNTIEDAQIAQRLWDVWLAGDSVTPSLRKSIAEETAKRVSPQG